MINSALRRRRWRGQRRGGNGAAQWRPTLLSGCLLWLRADLGISLNGSTVSAWADQSGNGNNATQAIGAKQPAWSATGFNGRPGITFAGAQGLDTSTITYGGIAQITVFLALMGTFGGTAEILESGPSVASLGTFNIASNANAANDLQFSADGNGTISTPFFTPTGFGSPAQINCVYNLGVTSPQATVRYNAATASLSASTGGVGSFSNQALHLGARTSSALFWTGTMSEVIVYNRALSAAEIVSVEKYIGAFWGVPS